MSLRLAATVAALVIALAGCTGPDTGTPGQSTPPGLPTSVPISTTTTSSTAAPVDYLRLLLTAGDLTDADDTFTERSRESQPNGTAGASAFFVNEQDNRAISDTFLIYSDAATASATLSQASGTLSTLVAGAAPRPAPVGTDGVMISGKHPQEDKAVTLLFFTEGRALVRLEFQSALNDATTDPFVINVGKMQEIALRVGLDSVS
jgi:hypothetical protein